MERREARFRDNIPGLPEVIQIDTSVRQSLEYLEKMASKEIWKPSASADSASTTSRQQTNQSIGTANAWHRQGRESVSIASNLTNPSGTTERGPRLPSKRAPEKSASQKELEAATVSTHSAMTPSVAWINMQRYNVLEEQLNKQKEALDQGLRMSEERLIAMEKKLDQLKRLDELESKIVTSMGYHVDTNTTLNSLTRQMDVMMQMLTRLTPGTQGDEVYRQASESSPLDRVRKQKSKQAGRETSGSSQCTTMTNDSTDTHHHEKTLYQVQSPQKKKQQPEHDDTYSSTPMQGDEREDVEMQCEDQVDAHNQSEAEEASNVPNQQEVMDRTDREMTTPVQRRLMYPTDREQPTLPSESPTTAHQLIDARSTMLPDSPQRNDVYPIFLPREAPPDLDDQYTCSLDPDGGAPD